MQKRVLFEQPLGKLCVINRPKFKLLFNNTFCYTLNIAFYHMRSEDMEQNAQAMKML